MKTVSALSLIFAYIATSSGFLLNNVPHDQQCSGLPLLCPQWCMRTDAKGCTVCSTNCQYNSGSGPMTSQQNGGLSIVNPNQMLSYPSLSGPSGFTGTSGNIQTNQGGNNFLTGFNPANMGPRNPYLSGGNNLGNPPNTGYGSNPSNPGGGSAAGTLSSGSGISQSGSGSGVAVAVTTKSVTTKTHVTSPSTKVPVTTPAAVPTLPAVSTPVPAVSTPAPASMTSSSGPVTSGPSQLTSTPAPVVSTCAPVRCVPPCDKGITLDAAGCPVCLCI